jgi:hypothetical protein
MVSGWGRVMGPTGATGVLGIVTGMENAEDVGDWDSMVIMMADICYLLLGLVWIGSVMLGKEKKSVRKQNTVFC